MQCSEKNIRNQLSYHFCSFIQVITRKDFEATSCY